jgi:hypothetical protein
VLLRNGVGPCRTQRLQRSPCLHELPSLDSVGLHACPTAWLASLGISPLERKTKPCAVAFERVIVDNDTYIKPFLPNFGDLCRVGIPGYRPITRFVVPDLVRPDGFRNEAILSLMPNSLPAVEQVAHRRFI